MFNGKLNPVAASMGRVFDKKIVTGIAIGVTVMFAGYATSQTSGLASTLSSASSTLLSQQSSVVADDIKKDAEDCATGTVDGTIGHSIGDALKIHTELASATPNVETLFDVSGDCFSGLSQIFDLSFTIPSLASILSAASSAVMQYAQKKICTAVNQVSGMVTSPINAAIGKVNGLSSFTDLNGMTNGLVSKGMSSIDPALGSEYHAPPPSGTTTVGMNPFNSIQTDFSGSGNTGGAAIGNANTSITALNSQIAAVQTQIMPAQFALQQAQAALASCSNEYYDNCPAAQQQVANTQAALNSLNQQLSGLLAQLSGVSATPAGTQATATAAPATTVTGTTSWLQKIGGLFN